MVDGNTCWTAAVGAAGALVMGGIETLQARLTRAKNKVTDRISRAFLDNLIMLVNPFIGMIINLTDEV